MIVYLINEGIRKIDKITSYLVKFAGQSTKEIKSTEEMRTKWPVQTIEFLQNRIEWIDPATKLKKVQDIGNDRYILGKPMSILCGSKQMKIIISIWAILNVWIFTDVSLVGRELFYWTHFEYGYSFLSENDAKEVCAVLVIGYLESRLEI